MATSATKYPDPDWRRWRSYPIIFSYILSGIIAVIFVTLGLKGLIIAILGSFIAFIIEVIINIEHPPSILATFLGILEKQKFIYLFHPILTEVIIIEGTNYLITKYIEPKL